MNKKTKRKYWIAAIIWFVTMVLANSINEYFHASPLIRGITVGFWVVAGQQHQRVLPRQPADTRHHRGLLGRGGLHPVQGPDATKDWAEEG